MQAIVLPAASILYYIYTIEKSGKNVNDDMANNNEPLMSLEECSSFYCLLQDNLFVWPVSFFRLTSVAKACFKACDFLTFRNFISYSVSLFIRSSLKTKIPMDNDNERYLCLIIFTEKSSNDGFQSNPYKNRK